MLGAWVFPSFLSVVPSKMVNFLGGDYHMFDKDIFYESALPGAGGVAVPLISCGPCRGCLGRMWAQLPRAATTQLWSDTVQPHLLLEQVFVFQLSLDIGFVKGKENIHIYRYLQVFACVGTFIMVEEASNFAKTSSPTSLISSILMTWKYLEIKLPMTVRLRENN